MIFKREKRVYSGPTAEELRDKQAKEDPVTLRNLGFLECVDHPLRVGGRFGEMMRCCACGAQFTSGKFRGGSIDYVIDPIFANELRRARDRSDQFYKEHGHYGPIEGT